MSEEHSEGGSRIYRYEAQPERPHTVPDLSSSSLEEIDKHIETHIGKVEGVFHELLSDLVHVDIHIVAPTPARPFYTLITSGMSDLPMSPPAACPHARYAELMICLPASWKLPPFAGGNDGNDDWKKPENYWPIRCLKFLARFPHEYKTWLWRDHTMPNGNPPEPLAPNFPVTGLMLSLPMTTPTDFYALRVNDEKTIHFFSVLPLFSDEMDLKLKQGTNALTARLRKAKVDERVNLKRTSAARDPWWKLF